jgi:hypothetical protein
MGLFNLNCTIVPALTDSRAGTERTLAGPQARRPTDG